MVEYLPVGPKGAPQTIFGKKYFGPEIPNPLSQPSVQCCKVRHFYEILKMAEKLVIFLNVENLFLVNSFQNALITRQSKLVA